MTQHQKRLSAPKSWPVERKEGTFTTKADAGPHGEAGVPLIIVLRDVLGYVDSKKEARYALGNDSVLVNGKPVSDESRPIGMFDILAFTEREEYYRVFPGDGGRLALTPLDADAADSKLGKVAGKRQVPGGETQLTLHDGQTLLVEDDDAYDTNDSLVVSNDDNEIVAHFTYEEGALVTAVDGTHAGEIGTVDQIQVTSSSSPNNVLVDQDGGTSRADGDEREGFETIEEYVVVIDENFTADDSDEASEAPEDVTDQGEEPEAETDGGEASEASRSTSDERTESDGGEGE